MIPMISLSSARSRWIVSGVLIVVTWMSVCASAARAQPIDTGPAVAFLTELLTRPGDAPNAFLALRGTGDADLAPIFAAMTRSEDKSTRLFATASLPAISAEAAVRPLLERLNEDSMMAIRAEAMAQLMELDALGAGDLLDLVDAQDETIRCLAARALVQQQQGRLAQTALEELTESAEILTACSARAALLKMGDTSQLPVLRDVMADDDTADGLLWVLLLQIEDEQITQATDLVRALARSDRDIEIQLRSYQVLASIADGATDDIAQALTEAERIVMRIGLLRLLSDQPDGPARLNDFSDGNGPLALLARLEVARPGGGSRTQRAAQDAIASRHPIVVNYVLTRAQQDIEAHGERAVYYQDALLSAIAAARPTADELGDEHLQAAQAAMLLGDLGTAEGLTALDQILRGPRNATCRAVAAGINKSKNPAVCGIMAPLLESPFGDLFVHAALTLGAHADPRANDALQKIVNSSDRYQPMTSALASWYLIRNAGQARAVAEQLAAGIR